MADITDQQPTDDALLEAMHAALVLHEGVSPEITPVAVAWFRAALRALRFAHPGVALLLDKDFAPASGWPGTENTPAVTREKFVRALALDSSCDDECLSEETLRCIMRDIRDHARRLLGEDAKA